MKLLTSEDKDVTVGDRLTPPGLLTGRDNILTSNKECSFPMAAATSHYQPGGLNNTDLLPYSFLG